MNRFKRLLACVVALLMIAVLFGCEAKASKNYTYLVDTGDTIKISLDTKDGYDISAGTTFEISCDEKVLSQGTFIHGEAYTQYVAVVESDENAKLLDSGTKDGNEYIFWSFNDREFNYAILIKDSDTGVILGNNVSEESARECFERLTFTVED